MALNKFLLERENILVNYDFLDLATGNAVQVFNCGSQKKTTTESYLLNDNTFYSHNIETEIDVAAGTADAKRLDLDFDVSDGMTRAIVCGIPMPTRHICSISEFLSNSSSIGAGETYLPLSVLN